MRFLHFSMAIHFNSCHRFSNKLKSGHIDCKHSSASCFLSQEVVSLYLCNGSVRHCLVGWPTAINTQTIGRWWWCMFSSKITIWSSGFINHPIATTFPVLLDEKQPKTSWPTFPYIIFSSFCSKSSNLVRHSIILVPRIRFPHLNGLWPLSTELQLDRFCGV